MSFTLCLQCLTFLLTSIQNSFQCLDNTKKNIYELHWMKSIFIMLHIDDKIFDISFTKQFKQIVKATVKADQLFLVAKCREKDA